ncbi:MAG: hypothetical protein D6683_13375 [Actinomyces sp.]|nr:MAG: hypothetical protein D6683_13375 [Actinomyces sp.]
MTGDTVSGPSPGPAAGATAPARRGRASALSRHRLAVVVALHALVGALVALGLPGPLLSADDVTHLALARTLAGGGPQPLPPQPPYGLLYPLLVAPAWAMGLSGGGVLVWARLVSVAAGSGTVVVAHRLARRVFRLDPVAALVVALVAGTTPALVVTASITWSERLAGLTVSLLVAVVAEAVGRDPSTATTRQVATRGAVVVVAAGAVAATHPRLVPVAVAGALVAAVAWRRRPVAAAVVAGSALLVVAGAEVAGRLVQEAALGSGGTYGAAELAASRGAGRAAAMVERGIGAVASATAATAGFALVGWLVAWREPRTRVMTVLAGVVVAEAGWFLVGIERADAWYHGRYLDVLAPVTLVAAGAALVRRDRLVLLAPAAALVAGLAGALIGPVDLWNRPRSPVMMLGVEAAGAPFGSARFSPWSVALVATVVAVAVVVTARRRRLCAGVTLVTVALGVASASVAVTRLWDGAVGSRVAEAVDTVERTVSSDGLVIDPVGLSPNVAMAAAWEQGLDRTRLADAGVPARDAGGDPLVLSAPDRVPPGAELVAEVDGAVFWR